MYSEQCSMSYEHSCQDVQECHEEYETVCDDQDTSAPVYDGGFDTQSGYESAPAPVYDVS